jgi:hypothetical protein
MELAVTTRTHVAGGMIKSWAAAVSDHYDDMEQPFVDTHVAAVLCVGGPCSYVAQPCIMNDFILQHATPLGMQCYNNTVALMFGHTMIWVAISEHSGIVAAYLCNRVHNLLAIDSQVQQKAAPTRST